MTPRDALAMAKAMQHDIDATIGTITLSAEQMRLLLSGMFYTGINSVIQDLSSEDTAAWFFGAEMVEQDFVQQEPLHTIITTLLLDKEK